MNANMVETSPLFYPLNKLSLHIATSAISLLNDLVSFYGKTRITRITMNA